MVSYFSDVVKDLKDRTQVATKVLMEGEGTAEVSLCSTTTTTTDTTNFCLTAESEIESIRRIYTHS
jgi:hypothetical protein